MKNGLSAILIALTAQIACGQGQSVDLGAGASPARKISTTAPITGGGDLTADRTLAIPAATASVDGYLAHADFTAFNAKAVTTRTINTTSPITGGGDLSADRTFAIPASTTSVNGYLTSTDWTTFNGKVGTSRTINTTAPITGGGNLSADRTIAIPKATGSVDGYLAAADFTTFANSAPSIGGAVTSGTAGSVLLVGAGPVLAQDNANFFWDATNHFLGLGTTTPASQLTVFQPVSGSKRGILLSGHGAAGGNDPDGMLIDLVYNGTGNRQLIFVDSAQFGAGSGQNIGFTMGFSIPEIFATQTGSYASQALNIGGPSGGLVGIGFDVTTRVQGDITAALDIRGQGTTTGQALRVGNSAGTARLTVLDNGATTLSDAGGNGGNVPHTCTTVSSTAGTATAACGGGYIATGGGADCGNTALFTTYSKPTGGPPATGWSASCVTNTAIVVYVLCCEY